MKRIFRVLTPGIIAVLAGCIGYRAPICTEEFRKDVPNLEGSYLLRIWNDEEMVVTTSRVDFLRKGRAEYASDQGSTFSCFFDGKYVLESMEEDYYTLTRVERRADGGFDLIPLVADRRVLDHLRVPYEIITPKRRIIEKYLNDAPSASMRTLIFDNSALPPEQAAQLLDAVSVKITIEPVAKR